MFGRNYTTSTDSSSTISSYPESIAESTAKPRTVEHAVYSLKKVFTGSFKVIPQHKSNYQRQAPSSYPTPLAEMLDDDNTAWGPRPSRSRR